MLYLYQVNCYMSTIFKSVRVWFSVLSLVGDFRYFVILVSNRLLVCVLLCGTSGDKRHFCSTSYMWFLYCDVGSRDTLFKYGTCTSVYHSVDPRMFFYDSYFVSVLYGSVFWRNKYFILLKHFSVWFTLFQLIAFCCKIYLLSLIFTLSKKEMWNLQKTVCKL